MKNLWNHLRPKPRFLVTIALKGGATMQVHAYEFSAKYAGDTLTSLSWKLCPGNNLLFIDLGQVAGITSAVAR